MRGIQAVVKELRIKKSRPSVPIVQDPPPVSDPKPPVSLLAILKELVFSFSQKIRFSIKSPLFVGISLILVIIIILLSIFRSQIVDHILFPPTAPTLVVPTTINKGIGVTLVNNEYIGISDGQYALDTNSDRQGRNLKIQACADLLAGNTAGAESLWLSDLQEDSNDAETLIYLEDQRVLASGAPYITFVVGVLLGTNTFNAYGRDYLQSAYVAQKEYNDAQKLPGGVKVRLLIAKSGSDPQQSVTIAKQVVEAAQFDPTIVGVMGWETSATSLNVLPILSQAHIPLVSGGVATDQLTTISPYFFRVGPPNEVTGGLLAQYIQTRLQPRHIVVFEDRSESYSQSLADAFVTHYTSSGVLAPIVPFQTGGSTAILTKSIQHVLQQYTPDLILFTSNDLGDMTTVLNTIANAPQYAQVKVAMGIAAYEVAEANKPNGYDHLLFASAASPDEWILFSSQQQPNFFKDYADDFDPQRQHVSSPYSYLRPDSFTMLGYDAMLALLQGSQMLLEQGKAHFKPDELRQALTHINLTGVSGGIAFGPDGNPVDKIHFVLSVDAQNHLQISAYQGCFALTPSCDPNETVITGKP